jgi:hypothetical protein
MNDIAEALTALEPTIGQRRRIDAHVTAWLEARDTPLAAEWLGLLKARPFSAVGLLTASTVSLAAATPAVWLVWALI